MILQVGLGSGRTYFSLEQGYDMNIFVPSGGTRATTIPLSSDQIRLNEPNACTQANNLVDTGTINTSND